MADVYISKPSWNKIINYAKAAWQEFKAEIGGMAVVYKDKDDDWQVVDPIILKQEVTAGTCSLDQEALANYYTKAGMKWIKKEFRFCWWHSHNVMQAFWSKTDTDTIDEYSDGDLSFALVVNVKGEYKFRISMWKPFESHQDVILNITGAKADKLPEKILAEVKDKCDKPEERWKTHRYHNSGATQYYKRDQTEMFNDSFNGGVMTTQSSLDVLEEHDMYDRDFNKVWDQVSEWMDDLVEGTLDHNKYLAENASYNEQLEKDRSKYRTLQMPDPVGDKLYCSWPEQFITMQVKTGEFKQLEERNTVYGY